MAKTFKGLDLDDDGNVKVCPLVGYAAFVPFGTACGLRLEYAPSEDRIETPEAVQLIMTPDQARELAEVLLTKAEQATEPPESGETQN